MSEHTFETAGLRAFGPQPPTSPSVSADREISVRSARKDGRQVVTLRCLERHGEFFIECEVYPVSGLRVEPLRPGPYRFATAEDAGTFMDEAAQSLTYLGCDVV